jgi:hypothetical protein
MTSPALRISGNCPTLRLMPIKPLLKRLAPPAVRALWQWARSRNSLSERLKRVGQAVARRYEHTVAAGPFQGMRYGAEAFYSGYAPKLIGCYEAELHPTMQQILARDYTLLVDIGAAEGYYAVGLARGLPRSRVEAFESDDHARKLCGELVQLNHVADRVTLRGACDPEALHALPLDERSLVICDCEGYEIELIDPAAAPALSRCDLLVEMHDCFNPRITPTLLSRFQDTHDITLIDSRPHDPADFPAAHFLPPRDRALAVDDLRGAWLQWAFMKVKTPPASPACQPG